jgi:GxxExxY protein
MGQLLHENLTFRIIGAAQEIYHQLGAGYLESVYEDALCYELDLTRIPFRRQVDLDVRYKDALFKGRFRADLLVDEKVLIENKAIRNLTSQDEGQLINYLKTTGLRVGLLFNFGASNRLQVLRRIF